jgi:hypothetical protein
MDQEKINSQKAKKVSLRTYLNQMYHASKNSAKKREARGRLEAGEHDIDLLFLEELWKKQDGKCYYSNIQMQFNKNEWKVSLERLDTNKGYIKDNVVLCCLEFNVRLQWSASKVDEITYLLNQNVNVIETNFSTKVRKVKYDKVFRIIKDGETYCKCTSCKNYKTLLEFNKIGDVCRECIVERDKLTRTTPRGHIKHLCSSAKSSAKLRTKKDKEGTERGDYDIDFNFLIHLYNQQNGLCAYSGLPLKFGTYLQSNWVASLERLDVTKGYTKDNVCLVCIEFNGPDHSITTGPDYGCAGWNPMKLQYFLAHVQHKKGLITDEELQAVIDVQKKFREKKGNTHLGNNNTHVKKYRQHTSREVVDAIQLAKDIYRNAKENYGHIYLITSPSGMQFVGQSQLLHQKESAILLHARKFGYTRVINELDKFGEDNMKVQPIISCRKNLLDYYNDYFIKIYDTLEPNGLNFEKSKVKEDVKSRISKTLINNAIRYDDNGEQLPKYVKLIDWKDRKGYAIVSHPKCKLKYFVSNKKSMEECKEKCITFLMSIQ